MSYLMILCKPMFRGEVEMALLVLLQTEIFKLCKAMQICHIQLFLHFYHE